MAAGVVGLGEALQQGFQIAMAGNRDAQPLALDPSVEALHHAICAGRVGPCLAMGHPKLPAGRLEAVSREAGAAVGQPMGDLEGKGLDGLLQEGDRAALGFIIPDGQVDEAGGAVDGHIEGPLAALAVLGAQLGPVLHVPVHEAKIVVFEGPVRFTGAACGRQAAQAFGFQDAVDRVAVKMGQKVGDPKREIIQGKAGRTP